MESRYKIVTQQITAEVLQKAGGATYGNIASKINMKLSGLNYVPRIEKLAQKFELSTGQFFVVGYDVSHPAPSSGHERFKLREKGIEMVSMEPSVVGFCGNYAKEPHAFVGDFFYQPARKESIDEEMLRSKMCWMLQELKKNRPNAKLPSVVFVVRNGLSEGEFPMAVEKELPALKAGCRDFNPSYQPKFVFVVVTKLHNKRFFGKDQTGIVNTVPGSVIDRQVVRADVPEFYLQSHRPLKGTVKIPQYDVAVKEIDITTDEIQAFLNTLCHSHQIVNSAISVPAPVYQARELAKRGRANYVLLKSEYPTVVPRVEGGMINFAELTKRLAYGESRLSNTRFTA